MADEPNSFGAITDSIARLAETASVNAEALRDIATSVKRTSPAGGAPSGGGFGEIQQAVAAAQRMKPPVASGPAAPAPAASEATTLPLTPSSKVPPPTPVEREFQRAAAEITRDQNPIAAKPAAAPPPEGGINPLAAGAAGAAAGGMNTSQLGEVFGPLAGISFANHMAAPGQAASRNNVASYLSMQVEGEDWRAELANRFGVYDEVMSNHYTPPTQFANDLGQGKFGSRGRGTGGIGADPDPNWVFPIPKPTPDGKFTAQPGKEF